MSGIKNLNQEDAIKKLKELAESARTCIFCTELTKMPISARPMALKEVDTEGNLWFISSAASMKNEDIQKSNNVQLFFSNSGASEYLSIYGFAKIYTDRHTIEEKWTAMANAWFNGKNDPNVTIIKVTPQDSKYWDTENGKVITLMKMAASAITGNEHDEGGIEGKLNV